MEENKEIQTEATASKKEKKEIKFSTSTLYLIFALASIAISLIARICFNFGAGLGVFGAIMSIVAYALPVTGAILSYLSTKKLTFEFGVNVVALFVALLCI